MEWNDGRKDQEAVLVVVLVPLSSSRPLSVEICGEMDKEELKLPSSQGQESATIVGFACLS